MNKFTRPALSKALSAFFLLMLLSAALVFVSPMGTAQTGRHTVGYLPIYCGHWVIGMGQDANTTCTVTISGGYFPSGNITWSKAVGPGNVTFSSHSTSGKGAPYPGDVCALNTTYSCSITIVGNKAGFVGLVWVYGGDSNNFGTIGALALTVGKFQQYTSTTVTCGSGEVTVGVPVDCTVTVKPTGTYAVTGKVAFQSGGTGKFSSCKLTASSGGTCDVTYTPTAVTSSPTSITALYLGDKNNFVSYDSTSIAQVGQAVSTITLSCPIDATAGKIFHCKVQVTGYMPTETVEFNVTYSGQPVVQPTKQSCTLSSSGKCTVPFLALAGTGYKAPITAEYLGDTNNLPATTSSTVTLVS